MTIPALIFAAFALALLAGTAATGGNREYIERCAEQRKERK